MSATLTTQFIFHCVAGTGHDWLLMLSSVAWETSINEFETYTKLALPQQFHETYTSKVYSNCLHISFLPFLFNLFSHSLSIMNKSQSLRQQAAQTIFVLPTFQWWYLALIDVVWRLILYRCWWLVFSNLPEEWCIINNIWLWHSYMMVSCIHTVWPQYGNKKFVWFFLFGFFFAKCM